MSLNDFLTRELSMVDVLLEMNDETKKRAKEETSKPKSSARKVDMRSIRTGWK